MPTTSTARCRGFSLIELLVAMAIFSTMGIAIVTLLARASDFSRSGTSTTETLDTLQAFTETLTSDVTGIYSRSDCDTRAPDVRLYSDVAKCDINADGKPDSNVRRLMFVRMVPEESANSVTRWAGTVVGAKAAYDQTNDLEEAAKGQLRATGGLMEVFWTALPDDAADPAVMTLWRGIRSPIGIKEPFPIFPSKPVSDPSAKAAERGPVDLAEVRQVARPVLSGVLYFGVEFWARRTQTWDPTRPPPEGPHLMWDSTRGVLPKGKGYDGFWFAKATGAQDKPSLDDPTDDTFPRRMRVTLVVEEIAQASRGTTVHRDIAPDATYIEVADTRFLPATDTAHRFVKIGAEWIEFQGIETGTRLTGCKRGVRGTVAAPHAAGERVHYGRTLVRELTVATFRDAYRDELPSITGRR